MSDEPGRIGIEHFDARRWTAASEALARADRESRLTAPDFERYGLVSTLLGQDEAGAELWARANRMYVDSGQPAAAARCAFWLGLSHLDRGEMALGGGWLARAARHVEEAGECPERWYLRVPEGLQILGSDPATCSAIFGEVLEAGAGLGDVDLAAFGRIGVGQALVRLGRPDEATPLLDDVMVSVVTGELSPLVSGIVYCAVIDACHEMFDIARAQQWTAALTAWCEAQPDLVPFRGRCLIYRAEMMQMHGDWGEAIAEATRASDTLGRHPAVGDAFYTQGELQRLRGNLDGADRAFRLAEEHGRPPEPGLALLRYAQGRIPAAATAIRHALNEATLPAERARLLPAAVEILLAAGEVEDARDAAGEIESIASSFHSPLLFAVTERCHGLVALANDDARVALDHLRRSLAFWQSMEVPYETARTREALADAATATGDDETARIHLEAARAMYTTLGAVADLRRLEGVQPGAGELTPRELEILRLLATGMTNRAIADTLIISEKTAANHVSNILAKLGLSSRAAATAYAYEHGLV